MARVYNRVKYATPTTGTGALAAGAPVPGYQSWAAAGAVGNEYVQYLIEEGTAWEYGWGFISGTDLIRSVVFRSTNANTELNLTGSAIVSCVPFAESLRGRHSIWVPALAMVPRVTNGATVGSYESTTNKIVVTTLDFDWTASEYAQFAIFLPPSWDAGPLTYHVVHTHGAPPAGVGIVWKMAGLALRNQTLIDQAFGTEVKVADLDGGTNLSLFTTAESGPMTLAAGGVSPIVTPRYCIFQIRRDPTDAQDIMSIDARLLGVHLFYTTNTPMDDVTTIPGDPP